MGTRKAIDTFFPNSVPNKPVIDRSHCRYFLDGSCRRCEEVCPEKAIDFNQKEERVDQRVGAIVVATGYDLFPKEQLGEYGYGQIKDVIDGLTFERMLSPNGPTKGKILRPSDGKVPKEMVFIQCVASRDPDRYMPYCSQDLLHVHGQTCHALQGEGSGRAAVCLLHGYSIGQQRIRGVSPEDRGGKGDPLSQRPGLQGLPG